MTERVRKQRSTSSTHKSAIIAKKFLASGDFSIAKDILIYISKDGEVDTSKILDASIRSGKNIYCPMVRGNFMTTGKFGPMKPGKFGIMEPEKTSSKKKFDIIMVPGAAFDKNGARVGRGSGYFDRFLAKASGKMIGLAYDFQIVRNIMAESHDVPMNSIITDRRVIHIKKNRT